MGTRAQDGSPLVSTRDDVGTWAREALGHIEFPDAAASVRLRWSPNPTPGQAFAVVPADNRAPEAMQDAIEARLAELAELPPSARLRIEVLNGTGETISGLTISARWRPALAPTASQVRDSTTTAVDAEWSEVQPAELARQARGGVALAGELVGSEAMVTIPARALFGLFLMRAQEDAIEKRELRGALLGMARENREFADVMRRGTIAGLDHVETSYALLLDRTGEAAKAPVEVELAKSQAAASGAPQSVPAQAAALMDSAAKLFSSTRPQRPAQPAAPAAAPTQPTAQPAAVPPAAPAQTQPVEAPESTDAPQDLGVLMDPNIPPELAASLLRNHAPADVLARLQKIAENLVKGGDNAGT